MKKRKDNSHGLQGSLFQPPGDWSLATDYPDLSGEKKLGIDVETRDPELNSRGPGFIRGDATVAGVAVSTPSKAWYFPIAHLGGGCLDRESVVRWLKPLLECPDRYIVGANLQYELEALEVGLGLRCNCRCLDVQVAEALLDEESPSNSLDALCARYLGTHKDEKLLREAADAYGVDPKGGLWKLHSKYVGAYAEYDAHAPIAILGKQLERLKSEDLLGIFELESKLLPILWQMRKQGIPVDLEAAQKLSEDLAERERVANKEFKRLAGYQIDPWSGPQIQRYCDDRKIPYPRTEKGNPSFTGEWLESFSDQGIQCIAHVRELNRMRKTFVDDWFFKNEVRGRIHPQWKQLASDDGGTRTGRMACANPNAQQVPAGKYRATGEANPFGKSIRSCFISDTGEWAKFDYKEQEPRILLHFANLCEFRGAAEMVKIYQDDPKADFYKYLVEIAGIDRRPAKDMFLGRCYGMGAAKMGVKLGKTKEEARAMLDLLDSRVPFVKMIAESCQNSADRRGYIKTLLGRRRHFKLWERHDVWDRRQMIKSGEIPYEDLSPLPEEAAKAKWPDVRLVRHETRKALNALIQGSAADMTKAAMVALWEQHKCLPYMQVHDELDIGVESEDQAKVFHQVIESCVEMTVPIRSDMTIKKNWS